MNVQHNIIDVTPRGKTDEEIWTLEEDEKNRNCKNDTGVECRGQEEEEEEEEEKEGKGNSGWMEEKEAARSANTSQKKRCRGQGILAEKKLFATNDT